jgi:hypothetical protein
MAAISGLFTRPQADMQLGPHSFVILRVLSGENALINHKGH